MSGLLFESFIQTIVTVEESTSLKLFKASKIIAIEFDINQTIALKITKTMFVIIQTMLTLIIFFSLVIDFDMILNFSFVMNISVSKFYARGDKLFQKIKPFTKKSKIAGSTVRKRWLKI